MGKWIKRITGLLGFLLILLVTAVIALPFIIDPNDYKPEIESLAAKQGIDLNLDGAISWQFFPVLGLSISDVKLAATVKPETTIAQVNEIAAAVAVMPLLRKQIRVNELLVDGAAINLVLDQQGKGNWESLGTTKSGDDSTPTDSSANTSIAPTRFDLVANSILIQNATLVYADKQAGAKTELANLNLVITDVNLAQRPFPMHFSVDIQGSTLAKPLSVVLNSEFLVNDSFTLFEIRNGTLSLPDAGLEAQLNTVANTADTPQFDGTFTVNIDDPPALFDTLGIEQPTTSDASVLSNMTLQSQFSGQSEFLNIPKLTMTLDDTTLSGSVGFLFADERRPLSATIKLTGDRLDIDRYRPPNAESTKATASADIPAHLDSPLPLNALRDNDATFEFQFEEIIFNKMPITQLDLAVSGRDGIWELKKFNANFYEGKLVSNGQLNARSSTATAQFNSNITGLALEPLLKDVADVDVVSGTIDAEIDANTQAASTQAMMNNLIASATFTGHRLRIDGFNVEEKYCQLVDQIKAGEEDEQSDAITWPQETLLNEVTGRVIMQESSITLETLQAQIAYLILAAKGEFNLTEQDYEISLPLTLTQNKSSENGCLVASEFLINREIDVLGCDGDLNALDPAEQCGLRSGAINDLAKEAVRYNVAKPKNREKINEKKQEVRDKVKNRLNDLLKR